MINSNQSKFKKGLIKSIFYNLVILLIFTSWTLHWIFELILVTFLIDLVLLGLSSLLVMMVLSRKVEFYDKIINLLFAMLAIFYLIDIWFFDDKMLFPLIISYSELIGLDFNHNFLVFLFLLVILFIKVLPLKLKFIKNKRFMKIDLVGGISEYFTQENNLYDYILLIISLPLAAFTEEFVYRSFFLSFLTSYLRWDIIISSLLISIVFGLAHLSSSKNFYHIISASISSLIYLFALVELGLLYAWILHLSTNIITIFFFYTRFRKRKRKDLLNIV